MQPSHLSFSLAVIGEPQKVVGVLSKNVGSFLKPSANNARLHYEAALV